jgi:type I restriction enzyme S subunit
MDAQTFLDNFATIADAPGGVQRLRELVLRLALQGRLVAPEETDEPVSSLVQAIDRSREDAIRTNGWRTVRSAGVISDDEIPWDIPSHWTWVRLDRLALPQAGFAFRSNQFNQAGRGVPLIRIRDIGNKHTECHFEGEYRDEFLVQPGDYLVGMDGNFNIRRWHGPSALLNQRVTRLIFFSNQVEHPFVTWSLQDHINALHGSRAYTTVQHLSGKQIAAAVIPLPPLAEQERIVAKVDELMGRCAELESRQKRRHRATTRSLCSALHALTEAETPGDLRHAWERLSTNWPALTSQRESLQPLRRSILRLAVLGRLAHQDPEDQPAAELLADIAKQQVSLKGERALPGVRLPVASPSVPAPRLPSGWEWTRLGALLHHCRNGIATRPNEDRVGYALLRISAGTSDPNGWVNLDDHKFAELDEKAAAPFVLDAGDLVACRFNGNLHYVGRVAVVPDHLGEYLHPDKLIRIKALSTDHRYLMIALNSPATRAQIEDAAATTAGNIGINGAQLQDLHLPVPPYAEQVRIADRVGHLIRLCAELDASLPKATDALEKLSGSLTSQLAYTQPASVTAVRG